MKELNKLTVKKSTAPERIVQFGEGNFLRAFVDYFFDVSNEKVGYNGKVVLVQPIAQDLPDPKLPSVQPLVDESGGGFVNKAKKGLATPIPFRVMVPQGCANLLCPGRAISVERDVLGPLRVMAPCMAMGEACGVAAEQVVAGTANADVDITRVRDILRTNGCIVDVSALPPIEPRVDP